MFSVRKARVTDLAIVKNAVTGIKCENRNFYSDPVRNVILHLLRRNCYIVSKKGIIQGVVIIKTCNREVFFYPCLDRKISFPSLLFVLRKHLKLTGYKLLLNYRNIDIITVKEYFGIKIISNFKYMYLKLNKNNNFIGSYDLDFKIRKAIIDKDEGIRVILQNRIFSEVHGRKELTLDEVINEEKDPKFIKDLCFILEIDSAPAGYGQILDINGKNFLVNFGIIPEYRGQGYSKIFLEEIISQCIDYGIDELFLSVDNLNVKALRLYRDMGFGQLNNTAVIEI